MQVGPVGDFSKISRIVLFANTDWYLYNFRRSLARALAKDGYDLLLLSPPGPYGERLRAEGFRWQAVPMRRQSLNPLTEFRLVCHLAGLLRRERPDLVLGLTIKCAVYGSFAARLARTPARVNAVAGLGYVFTSRDAKAALLRPAVRGLMRFALGGRGGRVIVQNPDDQKLLLEARVVAPESVRLIRGSGVDCTRFRQKHVRPGVRPLRVLLASRLLWDKGLAEYAATARELRDLDLRFLIAGTVDPGNPSSVPEETIRTWQSEGLIEWLGHVEDMPGLLASVDIVVLPSYREGLPKSLIEAAACGLALVTTDVPGCREVVTDEIDGLRVPARDARALANAIRRLAFSDDLRARLGQAARGKALAEFDERIVIDRTRAVIAELLGPPPGRLQPPGEVPVPQTQQL